MVESSISPKEQIEYTVKQKAYEEGWKLRYDTYKHLTTLSTGSILIIVTFLEKVFTNPKWKALVGLAFGLFLISIIASMFWMNAIASFIEEMKEDESDKEFGPYVIVLSLGSFLGGVICMIVFAIKNLYW